jgi:two-component system CheB/CheR fusion protein
VVVVNRDMRVQVWNAAAMNLWGLRPEEVQNAYLFGLEIGLPLNQIHQQIRDVVGGAADHREVVVQATNRTGKSIDCHVRISPLLGTDRSVAGAILLMEEDTSPSPA